MKGNSELGSMDDILESGIPILTFFLGLLIWYIKVYLSFIRVYQTKTINVLVDRINVLNGDIREIHH